MLPHLAVPNTQSAAEYTFIEELKRQGFAGDIAIDHGHKTVFATDNSIYQRFPGAVLFPAHVKDVVLIAELSAEARFRALSFCPRGGGTSTNGQSLGSGFIVDLSRYMNRILEINTEQGWARVEAGVVKDQLNAAVKSAGYFFAPDLSTSNRATIGGMINTDASGQGSCRYGKTRDHVLSLRCVAPGGDVWNGFPFNQEQLASALDEDNRWGEIYRLTADIVREHQTLIQNTYPVLNRALTGYDLAHVINDEGQFDINSLICGSEGSLAFVVEATVKLERLPQASAVVAIEYDSFVGALRHGYRLMDAGPTAIETVDDLVVNLAKGDEIWRGVQNVFQHEQQLGAMNLVEISGASEEEVEETLERLRKLLDDDLRRKTSKNEAAISALLAYSIVRDPAEQALLWTMRKKAVGLLGNMAGAARPVPFVEDTAVPPQNLADFISEFRALLDQHHLRYGMFGHGDAGVIHVRPALDMRDSKSIALVRTISDQVYALVRKYGGVLWGEHGKGLRSQYSPDTFGDLYPQLQRIKAAFDPFNQMNPGKLATPSHLIPLTKVDEVPSRGIRDRSIHAQTWDAYPEAVHCNGNGACFNWDPQSAMCPSYKGTKDRRFSPKGRAALFKEWLTLLAKESYRPDTADTKPSLRHLISRIGASMGRSKRETDFNEEVYRSMDECLACKACASQCPIHVDVPAFRSVFLQHYFTRYLRPLRHHLIANLERIMPTVARFPRIYNGATQYRPLSTLITAVTGLTDMPALRRVRWRRALRSLGVKTASPKRLNALSTSEKSHAVILVLDVFTRYFETEFVLDCCRLLKKLGFVPFIAPFSPNGKPEHVLGFLNRFQRTVKNTSEKLLALSNYGIDLVGLEPSMTMVYRAEYKKALGDNAPRVLQLSEWLVQHRDQLHEHRYLFNRSQASLLPHCTESTMNAEALDNWKTVFQLLGQNLELQKVGCCGMAGTYGHELHHLATSRIIYEQSWGPLVDNPSETQLCATGFSCRDQAGRMSKTRLPHPIQFLLAQVVQEFPEHR